MKVLGYEPCASLHCGHLVLAAVARATGGYCDECVRQGVIERLRSLKVAVGGGVVEVSTVPKPKTARNRRQHLRRKGDPRLKERKHASEKAKQAAWKRLAATAPELYAVILADERAKRGLTPITVDMALAGLRPGAAGATLDAIEFYRALSSQENAPDDPEHPHPNPPAASEAPERL